MRHRRGRGRSAPLRWLRPSEPGPRPNPSRWRRRSTTALGGPGARRRLGQHPADEPAARRRRPRERGWAAAAMAAASSSITSSPLFTGGSGRLWASKDGRFRLELQDQGGDTQVIYDGHTLKVYDAATNTLYRYTPPQGESGEGSSGSGSGSGSGASADQPRSPVRQADRRSDLPPAEPRLGVRRRAERRRRPARLHGAGRAQGSRKPVRRRRAVLQRRQRHSPEGRPLLNRQLLAGARTGGHRNLLRAGARLGLLDHPAVQREGRRSQARRPRSHRQARRTGPPRRRPARNPAQGLPPEGHHPRPRARDDRGRAGQLQGQRQERAASKACPR